MTLMERRLALGVVGLTDLSRMVFVNPAREI